MRVDSNTRGHTNWFYFEVSNGVFIGRVIFRICNFRRPNSLYQRGLRPYVWSQKVQPRWVQQGEDVAYDRHRFRYKFLFSLDAAPILTTFYALTFVYNFTVPHDRVRFAYSPPYSYSQLNTFLATLPNSTRLPPMRSLSGLPIPVLKISDESDEEGKKVALITARVHPGESNSSHVAEGFLEWVCGAEAIARELRRKYVLYVIPMMNPDGVVAGNYRTSLFGKDLNRTFDQSRRFAFPETYNLLRLAQQLKKAHKKRFCIYIDLHGHSIKKNVFMYGPDYPLQDTNYDICRELPKLLAGLTNYFRYYSCSFRIAESKAGTGRAVFNRTLAIPYTYTMECSNGCYFDFSTHTEVAFTVEHWKEMGAILGKALNSLKLEKLPKITRAYTLKIKKVNCFNEKPSNPVSDDEIQEDDSDMEPLAEDLPDEILNQIELAVKGERDDDPVKSMGTASPMAERPSEKKRKKKHPVELSKRQPKEASVEKSQPTKEVCAFQVPQRKNISFPAVFPVHRADIFISRQSRHDKYERPLQIRYRRNQSPAKRDINFEGRREDKQAREGRIEWRGRNSMSSKKVVIEVGEVAQSRRQAMHFHDLINKFKFNF